MLSFVFFSCFFSVFIILLFRVYFLHFTKISRMPNAKADGSLNTSCIIIGSMQTRVTDEATNEQKKIFFHFSMLRRECEYKVNARLSTEHTNDDVSLLLDFSERNFFQHFLPWKCVVFSWNERVKNRIYVLVSCFLRFVCFIFFRLNRNSFKLNPTASHHISFLDSKAPRREDCFFKSSIKNLASG